VVGAARRDGRTARRQAAWSAIPAAPGRP
jgi:hypothetical protein